MLRRLSGAGDGGRAGAAEGRPLRCSSAVKEDDAESDSSSEGRCAPDRRPRTGDSGLYGRTAEAMRRRPRSASPWPRCRRRGCRSSMKGNIMGLGWGDIGSQAKKHKSVKPLCRLHKQNQIGNVRNECRAVRTPHATSFGSCVWDFGMVGPGAVGASDGTLHPTATW